MSTEEFIINALEEDIGSGDHTSLACIPPDAKGSAHLLVKDTGVIAGVELAEKIFKQLDSSLVMEITIQDGTSVVPGDIIFEIAGSTQSILKGERLVLNCMQRMSGIATLTREMASSISDLNTKLLDTRKTTPGFRAMEKWAVKIGGGENHRIGLYDMIMIKDNHIDFSNGIKEALASAQSYLQANQLDLPIAIEARTIEDVEAMLLYGGMDRIMLDNMSPSTLKDAVKIIEKKAETEATGGITRESLREYAETGVDFISVGALTHSAGSLDLSLKASNTVSQ
ncbi:MAG TPA: carboxylating nicotinate-nucleotide diphosphorylase [Flavobacteriales bacterium]|nr:carboxylating nicotinate-nucleotide diphosphorylase [Flavobacteriales bacterium]